MEFIFLISFWRIIFKLNLNSILLAIILKIIYLLVLNLRITFYRLLIMMIILFEKCASLKLMMLMVEILDFFLTYFVGIYSNFHRIFQ